MLVTRTLFSLVLATAVAGCEPGPQGKGEAQGKLEVPGKTEAPGEAEVQGKADPPIVADPSGKAAAPKPDVPLGGKTKARLPVGTRFSETLTNPRNPVDEASWSPQPKIEGTAVEFIERTVESPPADVDGGSHSFRYRFAAIEAGRAVVMFTRSGPAKAPIEEVRVEVEVTEG